MKTRLHHKLLAAACALTLLLTLVPTAYAADGPVKSTNINKQDYSTYGSTVKSYLYDNGNGLTRVEYVGNQIVVEDYDSSFNFKSGRTIPMELPIWGGFYAGKDANYLFFGQNNPSESDAVEVIRVVKYSKSWQRLGQASLNGANTVKPFDAGSLRCDEYGGHLYIRTCHTMYTTEDGLNHQANVMLAIRESDMTVTDSFYDIWNSDYGYVSHSFNQFVIVDANGRIITLDHGDASTTRGVVWMGYYTDASTGKFSGEQYGKWCFSQNLITFAGSSGNNATGASIGGLAETRSSYIMVFNYDGRGGGGNRDVYINAADKATGASKQYKLGNGGDNTTPVVAPLDMGGGYVCWNGKSGGKTTDTLYYVAYTDNGQPSAVQQGTGSLSDCQPISYNGEVVWYVTNNSEPVFYTMSAKGLQTHPDSGSSPAPANPTVPTDPTTPTDPTAPTDQTTPTTPTNPDTPGTPGGSALDKAEGQKYAIQEIVGGNPNCEHAWDSNNKIKERGSCTEYAYDFWPCKYCDAKYVCAVYNPTEHKFNASGVCTVCGENKSGTTPGTETDPGENSAGSDIKRNPSFGSYLGATSTGVEQFALSLVAGKQETALPMTSTQTYTIRAESSDTSIVTVDSNLAIHAVKAGSAKVTYKYVIDGVEQVKAVVQVTVTADPSAKPETPPAASGGIMTGSADLASMSQQEIIDLLAKNSTDLPSKVYDTQPSVSAPYQAGKLSDAALQTALNRLNALRRIAGMPATSLDASWCDSAQYGAVILGKLGSLSHAPSQPSDMDKAFYDKAYAAANSSNISAGRTLASAVDGLMTDSSGDNLISNGHRRWQLSPALTKVGFGYVNNGNGYGTFVDEKVFERGAMNAAHSVSYDSFGWPAAGSFPNDLDAFTNTTPWSVNLNPDVYAAPGNVTVKISGGGKNWTLSGNYSVSDTGAYLGVIPADGHNYGNTHCIIFRPDGVSKYEGTYTVEVQGLKYKKDNSAASFTYTVDFFSTKQSNSTPNADSNKDNNSTGNSNNDNNNNTTPNTPSSTSKTPFKDVPATAYYADAVAWALDKGVTTGMTATTFAPDASCTRGQVVTFLWRAMGKPEPQTKNNPFRDVKTSDYYYSAVLWAYENNITTGVSAAHFNPNDTCTNGHVVTFLWRTMGKPAASGSSSLANSFENGFYTDAVAWADTSGLLKDTGSAFNPTSMSPRANIVTYLYRNLAD